MKDRLPFPRTKIPEEGRSDPRPINYGYKYFHQMFNERQLLCLSLLLEEVLKLSDWNTAEYMLLAFSALTETNCMFSRYRPGGESKRSDTVEGLFARHAFWPPNLPAEGNIWGAKYGGYNFKSSVQKLLRAKKYAMNPHEPESMFSPRKFLGDSFIRPVGLTV